MGFKKLINIAAATLLSMSPILLFSPSVVHAIPPPASLYWTGAGVDQKFSTINNWNTAANGTGTARVPIASDVLDFPATASNRAPIVDQATVVSGIEFTGVTLSCTTAPYSWYTLSQAGAASVLTIGNGTTGFIENSLTGSCNSTSMDNDITASGALSLGLYNFVNIGVFGTTHTLNLGSNSLTFYGSNTTNLSLSDKLVGSGSINAGPNITLSGDNSGFTGNITTSSFMSISEKGFGTGTLTFAAGGYGNLTICDGQTSNAKIALNGASQQLNTPKLAFVSAICPVVQSTGQGGGGGTGVSYDEYYANTPATSGDITLGGTLSQDADQIVTSYSKTTTITSSLSGAHNLNVKPGGGGSFVINSAANASLTPNGTYKPAAELKTLADISQKTFYTAGNYILTLDGERGDGLVDAGATLNGVGKTGKLTVNAGAILAPGHSPGCISSSDLVLKGTYQVQIGGTDPCTGYDQMKVTGTVTIDPATASLDVSLFGNFTPTKGQSFTIIDNDGSADAVTGTFKDLAEGSSFASGGNSYRISYKGGDGNDVVLTYLNVGAPNTGFSLISANPLTSVAITTSAALGLFVVSRRYKFLHNR